MLPAASRHFAATLVTVFAVTIALTLNVRPGPAGPSEMYVSVVSFQISTTAQSPPGVVPVNAGVMSLPGEAGRLAVMFGTPGAMLSCVYRNGPEKPDGIPPASRQRARRSVVAFGSTGTGTENVPP